MGITGKTIAILSILALLPATSFCQEPTIEDLQTEIEKLKRELKQANKLLEQATAAGFIATKDDTIASVLDVIKTLPPELELTSKQLLNPAQANDAKQHLSDFAVGKQFKTRLRITDLRLTEDPDHSLHPTLPKFTANITFEAKVFARSGFSYEQVVSKLKLTGDESFAAKVRRLRKGKAYPLSGTITEFTLRQKRSIINQLERNKFTVSIALSNIILEPLQ